MITEKVIRALPGLKAEAAGVVKGFFFFLIAFFSFSYLIYAQLLRPNETQVNFSGYFDSFNVQVLYPSIEISKHLSETTNITGRYLVDMITAASIRSHKTPGNTGSSSLQKVDAVTAASVSSGGGGNQAPSFDEVRHEFNLGFAHLFGKGLLSVDGLYSTESDYTSSTLIGNYTQYFAENDASLQLGFVRSWDKVFPKTVNWKKDKNTTTVNLNFSQIISKSLIIQLLSTYTDNNGLLSDNYKLVPITIDGKDSLFQPIHPDLRIRRAAALSLKYRLSDKSSIQLGYRYYWDSWDINADTYSAEYDRYLSKHVIMGLGWRTNVQSRAFFFKPEYPIPEQYMTTDITLDSGYSNELQMKLILTGGDHQDYLPFLSDDRVQYILNLNLYLRHTESPYWFNNLNNLFATDLNIGIRYRY